MITQNDEYCAQINTFYSIIPVFSLVEINHTRLCVGVYWWFSWPHIRIEIIVGIWICCFIHFIFFPTIVLWIRDDWSIFWLHYFIIKAVVKNSILLPTLTCLFPRNLFIEVDSTFILLLDFFVCLYFRSECLKSFYM